LTRHLSIIGAPIVEQFFRHARKLNPVDLVFITLESEFILLNQRTNSPPPTNTFTRTTSEIMFIDWFNLFIPFDYLPNWRRPPLHNELLHVFCLVRELAGVQQENRSVAMRCHPSIQTSQISAGDELRRGSFTVGVSATITALRASAPEKPSTYN